MQKAFSIKVFAAAAVLAAAAAVPARADFFTPTSFMFDPSSVQPAGMGTGPVLATKFAYANDSVIAVNGNQAVANFLSGSGSTTFTTVFQSSMESVQNAAGQNLNVGALNMAGGYQLTIIGQLTEQVVGASSGIGTNSFKQTPAVGDFVQIWASPINNHVPLTGANYGTGTLIYSATATANPGTAIDSTFTTTSTNPVPIDNFTTPNPYPNTQSIQGVGSSIVYAISQFFDPTFFPDAAAMGLVSGLTQGQTFQNLPFTNVDPTAMFFNGQPGVPSVGAINGGPIGPMGGTANFMFESNFVQEFGLVTPVPEPGTLALSVLGFAGFGLARVVRGRRKA
jgi:hypothetical protein